MFRDREAAGRALADELARLAADDPVFRAGRGPVVMALPRGGVPIGLAVARTLDAPLDLVLVRKLGVPWQPELAAAAVVNGDAPETVLNERVMREAGLVETDLAPARERALAEIERRRAAWLSGRARPALAGRAVIVVDDGVATGSTARAALKALRRKGPAALILAVPVGAPDSLAALGCDADRVVCLDQPEPFLAIGQHYRDFRQLDDAEVIAGLDAAPADRAVPGTPSS